MKQVKFAIHYIQHFFKAVDEHGVHSPFVFDLLTKAIYVKSRFYAYKNIENLREQLIDSSESIQRLDFGTGKSGTETISRIAKHSGKSPTQAQLLFRLVNYFQPTNVLELGTSLGISTCYLASANSNTNITSIEGCPNTANIAKKNFEILKLKNIKQIIGNFDEALPSFISKTEKLDFVFFDGNHRKEPTISYFNQCITKAHNDSVFIFDDIHWSGEMTEAWEHIKNHPQVTVTLDLFFMGLVFFRKEQSKQHFLIRF